MVLSDEWGWPVQSVRERKPLLRSKFEYCF